MPYVQRINTGGGFGSASEKFQFIQELNTLRSELDDMRAKYTALVALLVAATALGAGYNTGTALVAKQFTPT